MNKNELIERAKTFLNQPIIKEICYETKKDFLIQKGLNEEEIKNILPTEIIEYSPFWKFLFISFGISGSIIGIYYLYKNYIFPWWKKHKKHKK